MLLICTSLTFRKFLDEETKKEGLDLLEWELFNDKVLFVSEKCLL